jgi:hypothetical protein
MWVFIKINVIDSTQATLRERKTTQNNNIRYKKEVIARDNTKMVFFTLGMIIRTIRRETNIHLA